MTGTANRQATLLGIPREVRHLILKEAVAVRRPAPVSPSTSQDRVQFRNRHDPAWPKKTNIYVEADNHAQSAQASLLAICRQVREEVRYILDRTEDEPYQLDVMFVDQCGILPTWVSFPRPGRRIKHVDIRVRLFKLADDINPQWVRDADFNGDEDGSVRTAWNLRILLTAYLLETGWRGPSFPPDDDRGRAESEPMPDWDHWLEERERWCAIDTVTVTIEDSKIPMEPWDEDNPTRDVFAHTIFRGSEDWPEHFRPPSHDPDRAYGPHFQAARAVWRAVDTMSRGVHPNFVTCELMFTHMGRVDILVGEDYEYARCDITEGFCQEFGYYCSTNYVPPGRRWMPGAAERRRQLGMWKEA